MRRSRHAQAAAFVLALTLASPAAAQPTWFQAGMDALFARPMMFLQGVTGAVQYALPVAPVLATTSRDQLGPAFDEMVTKPMRATFTKRLGTFSAGGPIVRNYGEVDVGRMDEFVTSNFGWLFSLTNPLLFVFPALESGVTSAITEPRNALGNLTERWDQFGVQPSRFTAGLQ